MKVKTISKKYAEIQVCPAPGCRGKTWPFSIVMYVKAAQIPPASCTPMYLPTSLEAILLQPEREIATVTAGLKCAPEQVPRAKIMHMRDAAMDQTGALEPPNTFSPTVRTNIYVPRNSLSKRDWME